MRSTTDLFNSLAVKSLRPLGYGLFMSFLRDFDADVTFFTIGVSSIGGRDIIKSTEADVVQEWDKYSYVDYTHRIIDIQTVKETTRPYSTTIGMADLILDNYDDYFTPGKGSEIDGYILPYRPIRLFMGFETEIIPMFVGLTDGMPIINEKDKTATFHCVDFLYSLKNRPLSQAVLYQDETTDTIIEGLFTLAGLTSVQLDLDTGLNTIPYAYFEKDMKLGDALDKLVEAEMGRLYMNELGVIIFKNRLNYDRDTQFWFNAYDNIFDTEIVKADEIINVVEVKGEVREAQPNQKYWELAEAVEIEAGGSVEVWANFDDPVTSVDTPAYITSATTSLFTVNTASDGSGTANATDVTLSDHDLFSRSYKMTFANSGAGTLYLTAIELYGVPVKKLSDIYVRVQNDDSVDDYDERVLTIDNEYIQNESTANSIANVILAQYFDYREIKKLDVKGTPALQVDDPVEVNIFDNIQDVQITKITNQISYPAVYKQLLEVKKQTLGNFFTIGVSSIGGEDIIAP